MAKQKKIAARLMRLTWNKFNWQRPQGHKWSKSKQGNTSIAYEQQYGFGHEEWFLNPDFHNDGYQYGYIRGVDGMPYEDLLIDKIILFTIHGETKVRYLVGELSQVEIIPEPKKIKKLFKKELKSIIDQLKEVGADYKVLEDDGLGFNVRFKPENATIYPELIFSPYINNHKSKFSRFQPFKLSIDELGMLGMGIIARPTLDFLPGEIIYKEKFKRVREASESDVARTHSFITKDLFKYHRDFLGISEGFLSAEKTTIGPRVLDFVLLENGQFSIFEVKTSLSGFLNFRQALGQLFEYAFIDSAIEIKKLIIVGPVKLNEMEINYLKIIRKLISVSLEYWAYEKSENDFAKKFLIY
tara:strand:- start:5237 stop:6304 length:1068 start_codon:yes stop_codon:yes gene_type:complete